MFKSDKTFFRLRHIIDMHYIYHIPGIKIGVTINLELRMKQQGFTEWEVLEIHDDGWLAGDREIELQKQYGYPVDSTHYMHAANLHNYSRGVSKPNHPGPSKQSRSKGGKGHRYLTFEEAEEIRTKYVPRKYTVKMLSEEYSVLPTTIRKIIYNQYYLD